MDQAEDNALVAALDRFRERAMTDAEDRIPDMVPSSRMRRLVQDAFRAGWLACRQYEMRQGGPG